MLSEASKPGLSPDEHRELSKYDRFGYVHKSYVFATNFGRFSTYLTGDGRQTKEFLLLRC